MPVVINEFEVVADTPSPQRKNGGDPAGDAAPSTALAPCAIAVQLRTLGAQALRAWAH